MNEAINSATAIALAQHREEIAKKIESEYCNDGNHCDGVNDEHCEILRKIVSIVRGTK